VLQFEKATGSAIRRTRYYGTRTTTCLGSYYVDSPQTLANDRALLRLSRAYFHVITYTIRRPANPQTKQLCQGSQWLRKLWDSNASQHTLTPSKQQTAWRTTSSFESQRAMWTAHPHFLLSHASLLAIFIVGAVGASLDAKPASSFQMTIGTGDDFPGATGMACVQPPG
jgi:hypothetical protein